MHARFEPVSHRFVYPIYTYAFDLDELPRLNQEVKGFSYNRFNLAAIHDRDYLQGNGSIKERLLLFLKKHGCADDIEKITMITMARFLNYCFNPVSFFYCYRSDGSVRCHAAEVNNTFGERHLYLLDQPLPSDEPQVFRYRHEKEFFVSPFNDRSGYYELSFSELNDSLRIGVTLFRDEKKIMTAWLQGKGMPLNSGNLQLNAIHYPFTAALSVPRITFEALNLFLRKKLSLYPKPGDAHPMTIRRNPPSIKEKAGMRIAGKVFNSLKTGTLELQMPDGSIQIYPENTRKQDRKSSQESHRVIVHDYAFFGRLLKSGDVGLGEAFVRSEWSTPDLTGLLRFFIQALPHVKGPLARLNLLPLWRNRYVHWRNRNTKAGSKKNISAHYDLGNDFYKLFLDNETMLYSCGIFKDSGSSLARAQKEKVHEIIRRAEIKSSHHVLEIGCGWGGFAIEAARHCGCRVTGITLSKEQLRYAQQRAAEEKIDHLVEFKLCDYRDMSGCFDRIVSIEMLEAVGHAYYHDYFSIIERMLQPAGQAVIQVITIPDERFKNYSRNPDWIQLYIFPGGALPSLNSLKSAVQRSSSLTVASTESIGLHYATTLRVWRDNFNRNCSTLYKMGFDEYFQRKWNYYFSYCEAGFAENYIDDLIITLRR